jgi:hypothetical protein
MFSVQAADVSFSRQKQQKIPILVFPPKTTKNPSFMHPPG